jgi:UDP-N-acetylmuramoyl-L-alanyl-D-glutamate--2,6-diaminopimelate ligase
MCADLDKPLNQPFKITNRRQALAAACALQQADDVLVVLGKGHESYQEVQGVRLPFDDRNILGSLMSGEVSGDD